MKLNPFLYLSLSVLLYNGAVAKIQYSIETNWDGKPVVHPAANLTLSVGPRNDTFTIHVQAAYFGSPEIPDCKAGYPYDALYNFEVVETFFLCSESNEYVELEFAPCGAHLVLLLYPTRNALVQYLPLEFTAQIDRQAGVWIGDVIVPTSFLPADVNRFNAFAIHSGTPEEQAAGLVWEDGKVYEALYPVLDGDHPDFHNLEVFEEFSVNDLQVDEGTRELWTASKNKEVYYNLDTSISGDQASRPTQVWLSSNESTQMLNIKVRQEKVAPAADFTNCDSLYGSEDMHDNSVGVQVYLAAEDGLYLQVILGYTPANSSSSSQDKSECVSASFLQGNGHLLERRFGSDGDNVNYTESMEVLDDKMMWTGNLEISWDYLPPNLKTIQIINNDDEFNLTVDDDDTVLFDRTKDNPLHKLEYTGLVYSELLVDPEYNAEISDVWQDIISKQQ